MNLGKNIYYLRKKKKITQEQLAEKLYVSRQTISKWESGEIIPELNKLLQLSDFFSCKLDALVRENLTDRENIYSEIKIRHVKSFRMARYVMITPNPEDDVNRYMDHWAREAGLLSIHPDARRIGWDFPHVTQELQNRFGLRGYAAAYILPEGFDTDCPGVEYACQEDADYAVLTVRDPFASPFERVPGGYKKILEYLQANDFHEKPQEEILSCFEYVYENNRSTYMDIYLHINSTSPADVLADISVF